MIQVRVRFYASFREIAGGKHADLSVPEGATLGDLQQALFERWPALREFFIDPHGRRSKRANLFLDGRAARFLPAGLDTPLSEGQEVDCFPAVAGG